MSNKVFSVLVCLIGVISCFSQSPDEAIRTLSWFEKEFSVGNPRQEIFQKRNTDVLLTKYFSGKELESRKSYLGSFPAPSLKASALFHEEISLVASVLISYAKDSVVVTRVYQTESGQFSMTYVLIRELTGYMVGTWRISKAMTPSQVNRPRMAEPLDTKGSAQVTRA